MQFQCAVILALLAIGQPAVAQFITEKYSPGYMYLATSNRPGINVLVSENEYEGVTRAAGDLALDFGRVLEVNGTVQNDTTAVIAEDSGVVIVGTIGNSSIIDELVKSGKIDVSVVQGKVSLIFFARPVSCISQSMRGELFTMHKAKFSYLRSGSPIFSKWC